MRTLLASMSLALKALMMNTQAVSHSALSMLQECEQDQ